MRDVRTHVGDFKRHIASQFVLDGEVPLLCIPGAKIPIHGEHTLSESGIWGQRNGSDTWSS
jgi:hypothetical protein